MGLFTSGIDTRPLVLANPRKSSVPSPRPIGLPHREFTELWLGTRWAPSNPFVARGPGRFGHRQAAVAFASGRRRCPIRSGGWSPTPLAGSPTTPDSQFRRRRDAQRSRSHRAGCHARAWCGSDRKRLTASMVDCLTSLALSDWTRVWANRFWTASTFAVGCWTSPLRRRRRSRTAGSCLG